MACGSPKKYDGIDPATWSRSIEDSEVFQKINTDVISVFIAIATLILALLTFLKK